MLMTTMLLRRIVLFKRDDRGLQLVELAIALPVLILLFAAVAEFGRYFEAYTTLAKGSRTAARYLATADSHGLDDLNAKKLVVYGNLAGAGSPIVNGLTLDNVDIIRRDGAGDILTNGEFPTTVTVEIKDFKHTPIFDLGRLMSNSLSFNIDIKPSVTMRFLLTQPSPPA
jgi:Flp pilus assembly protein TadG